MNIKYYFNLWKSKVETIKRYDNWCATFCEDVEKDVDWCPNCKYSNGDIYDTIHNHY